MESAITHTVDLCIMCKTTDNVTGLLTLEYRNEAKVGYKIAFGICTECNTKMNIHNIMKLLNGGKK